MFSREEFESLVEALAVHMEQKTGVVPDIFTVTARAKAIEEWMDQAEAQGETVGFAKIDPDTKQVYFVPINGLFPSAIDLGAVGDPGGVRSVTFIGGGTLTEKQFPIEDSPKPTE